MARSPGLTIDARPARRPSPVHEVFGRAQAAGATPATRTVGLVGHAGSGKTQLAEILLHAAGVVRTPGAVDRGGTLLDGDAGPEARGQGWPSYAWLPWGNTFVHLVDTPGRDASSWPARLALGGVDAEVLVVSGPDGVACGAEAALVRAKRLRRPVIAVVNKSDRPHDLAAITHDLATFSGRRVAVLQLPLRERGAFVGVIDLLGDVALRYDPDGSGACSREPVPVDREAEVRAAREALLETIALTDDDLLEAFLERLELTPEEAWAGLQRAVRRGEVLPVVLASGAGAIGAGPVLDAITRLTPDPAGWRVAASSPAHQVVQWIGTRFDETGAPVALLRVWAGHVHETQTLRHLATGTTFRLRKLYQLRGARRSLAKLTGPGAIVATWELPPGKPGDVFTEGPELTLAAPEPRAPMAWRVVEPVEARGRPALDEALRRLALVDPSVTWEDEPDSAGVRLAGTSHAQLDAWVRELRRRFGLRIEARPPPVTYVERPLAAVVGHGVHRRLQGGEVAAYGEVWLDVAPTSPDVDWRFEGAVDDDELPERFVPAVGIGARRALRHGPTAGYPVAGVAVRCTGGEYDALESTEQHFETAGEIAMRRALEQAGTELLEPWHEVVVHVPGGDVGAVLADVAAHRGRVVGLEVVDAETAIRMHCPESELGTLGRRLEALTRGRGWFVARRSHYDRLPDHLVGEAVASSPYRRARFPVEAR